MTSDNSVEKVAAWLRDLRRRPKCVLYGCITADEFPGCHRCEEALYGGDYVQVGKLEWWFELRCRVRLFLRKFHRKKCEECGRKYWRGYDAYLCSEECHDNWLPF